MPLFHSHVRCPYLTFSINNSKGKITKCELVFEYMCLIEREREIDLPKCNSMSYFKSLPVFIRIEVCLHEQRIDDARNQTEKKYFGQRWCKTLVVRVFGGEFLVVIFIFFKGVIFFFNGRCVFIVFPFLHFFLIVFFPDWLDRKSSPKWDFALATNSRFSF